MKRKYPNYDFVIVGAGIFGVATALYLAENDYSVALLNPGVIPHSDAASTDISKIVRMEYGSDLKYMKMVSECLPVWREWNERFERTLYHETGFLLLSKYSLDMPGTFESESYRNLGKLGYQPERLTVDEISDRFPAFEVGQFAEAMYNRVGGYAESGKVVTTLLNQALMLGVALYEQTEVTTILQNKGRATGVKTTKGSTFNAGHVIVCAGNCTPYLVPGLQRYMHVTGHPVFHLKPDNHHLFQSPHIAVFGAAITETGWYGFPLHPSAGVVKVAHHGDGLELDPRTDERVVHESDVLAMRQWIKDVLPALAGASVMFTRICCYTDTLDGHFWIDRHPEIANLTVGSGGSGHGFKMAPVIGELIAYAALGKTHKWSARFRWRDLKPNTPNEEQARSKT